MVFQPPSVDTLSKFGYDTVDPCARAFEYKSFSVGKHNTVLSTDGLRGTRSHPVERTRAGTYTVGGSIAMEPGPTDLDFFLPLILGGTKQPDNSFSLAETISNSGVIVIDRIANVHKFLGCAIDRAHFRCSSGSILELTIDVEGKTETLLGANTFPAVLTAASTAPTISVTGGGSTGGLLAAGTYYAKYTWVNGNGETTASTESTIFTVSAGNIPRVTFPALPSGATVNLYLTLVNGAINTEVLYKTGINATTFDCAVANTGTAVPPTVNTAGLVSVQTPYVMMDCVLTINATQYQFGEMEVVVDNSLKKDRFMNSTTRTDLPALDRNVSVTLSLPYTTDQNSIYDLNNTSVAVVMTFTNGSNVFTISLPACQFPTQPPNMPMRNEITLPLSGQARKTGSTPEVTFSNTP